MSLRYKSKQTAVVVVAAVAVVAVVAVAVIGVIGVVKANTEHHLTDRSHVLAHVAIRHVCFVLLHVYSVTTSNLHAHLLLISLIIIDHSSLNFILAIKYK